MRWCWNVFTISLRKEVEAPGNRKHQSHCGAAVSDILNHHSHGLYGNLYVFNCEASFYIYVCVNGTVLQLLLGQPCYFGLGQMTFDLWQKLLSFSANHSFHFEALLYLRSRPSLLPPPSITNQLEARVIRLYLLGPKQLCLCVCVGVISRVR